MEGTEIYGLITTILTLVFGGGWFINWRASRKQKDGEAMQAEAEGWRKQQDVYETTIEGMRKTCEYIKADRDELRQENTELKAENKVLRGKVIELEGTVSDVKREMARQGRRIEALVQELKEMKKKQ